MRIRDVTAADLPRVHALNEAAVPATGSVPVERLDRFRELATYFRVAAEADRVVGFLVAFAPEAAYDSPNFLWFRARYDRFLYIDRIVVAEEARGQGIGRRLYDDLRDFGGGGFSRLTCEVNLRPRNDGSLRFHARYGFVQVGTQETDAGAKLVSMLVRDLDAPAGGS